MLASKNAQRVLPSSRVAIVRRVGWNFTDEDQLQVELAGFPKNPDEFRTGHMYLAPLPFG
jgi:hypothetical protein